MYMLGSVMCRRGRDIYNMVRQHSDSGREREREREILEAFPPD